ncbi:hypothetical protein D3C79_630680 [compost metagenome]
MAGQGGEWRAALAEPGEQQQGDRREQAGPHHKGKHLTHFRAFDDDVANAPAEGADQQYAVARGRRLTGAAGDNADQTQGGEYHANALAKAHAFAKQQHAPAQGEEGTELDQQGSGAGWYAQADPQVDQCPHRHAEDQAVGGQPAQGHGRAFDQEHPGQGGEAEAQGGEQQRVDLGQGQFADGEVQAPDGCHQHGEQQVFSLHGVVIHRRAGCNYAQCGCWPACAIGS